MSDIADFVLARITEREADAECWHHWLNCDYAQVAFYGPSSSCECNGKAWVLADCEAKRRIVERYQLAVEAEHGIREAFDGEDSTKARVDRAAYSQATSAWADAVRLLASVDADHPDFDETWRV